MAAILLNGAGVSAADPILDGLAVGIVGAAPSVDVSQVNSFALDPATGAVTNDLKANGATTPAYTVILAGTNGAFTDTTNIYTVTSTAGLAAGDYIWMGHASITDGIYEIATVPDGTTFTLTDNPADTLGDLTSMSYQAAWLLPTALTTVQYTSSGAGTNNFAKLLAEDAGTTETTQEDNFWVRDALTGSAYIALAGVNYTGQTVSAFAMSLAILSGWTNQGGISHVELVDHGTQAVNNFTWTSGGGIAEKTLADAETSGLTAAATDGIKYGRLALKSKAGGTALNVDISVTIDSTGPTLSLTLVAQ